MSKKPTALPTVAKHYAGKWVVWNRQHSKIIASGSTLAEARQAATKISEEHPVFAKMPPGLFVGLG